MITAKITKKLQKMQVLLIKPRAIMIYIRL